MDKENWYKVLNAVGSINKEARKIRDKFSLDDWVPTDTIHLSQNIYTGEGLSTGAIKPGMTVLDMGSGSGSSAITWAYYGYNVIGIELHPELADFSKEAVEENKHLFPNSTIQIFQGSYFPKEYIELREQRKTIAQKLEKPGSWFNSPEHFHPICEEDVYEKNGLDLKKIDIFYAYPWGASNSFFFRVV